MAAERTNNAVSGEQSMLTLSLSLYDATLGELCAKKYEGKSPAVASPGGEEAAQEWAVNHR